MLIFSEQDIVKDPPFSRLDLISCRNLLIYLNSDLQKRLIPLFHYALLPKGFLFLGNSENVADYSDLYTVLDRKLKLYQRREGYLRLPGTTHGSYLPTPASPGISINPGGAKAPPSGKLPWREITEHALLLQATPVAALVNAQGNVLYLHGRTGMYLEPAAGDTAVSNILRMAREGLRRDLTTAIHKASVTRERVHCNNVRVKTNGNYTLTNVTVNPVAGTVSQEKPGELPGWDATLFLITFEPAPAPLTPEQSSPDAPGTGDHGATDTRVAELQQELKAKEEYLQTTIEELETTNEELKSSNEEMQSVNEELQSTNEELETSKEELQSVNEELATVNTELQAKVTDLSRVNNDMNNLLAGTGIGTVFVDHSLHILRFTPAATRVINLIQGDIGRPVGHLVSNLDGYDSLSEDTRSVLASLIPKEIDVRTRGGVWFTMRIQPYRTLDNVIEGAVITFVEITGIKKSQQEVREGAARFTHLAKTIPVIMTQVDANLRFTWVHDPHQELFASSVLGRIPSALADDAVIKHLIPFYQRVILTGVGERTTLQTAAPDGERVYTVSVEPLQDETGAVVGATTTASRTGTTLMK
jgi:two-component system CheB/CheR fusion protein